MDSRDKLYSSAKELAPTLGAIRGQKQIAFTNGCFDLLHVGHVTYLERARSLADVLIVGVNSDASARRLNKGPNRPVNDQIARARVLCALECVSYVLVFDEDTPAEVLGVLRPDIHCKGGDYTAAQLPEASVVASYGGRIEIIPFVDGFSTTDILRRAKTSER